MRPWKPRQGLKEHLSDQTLPRGQDNKAQDPMHQVVSMGLLVTLGEFLGAEAGLEGVKQGVG